MATFGKSPLLGKTPAHEIEIEIDEYGMITGKVLGINGAACSGISKFLDELGEVLEDRKTNDYFRPPARRNLTVKR